MATAIIVGVPNQPYITVDHHFKEGDVITWQDGDYEEKLEVVKADPITRENQGQNVYVKPKKK